MSKRPEATIAPVARKYSINELRDKLRIDRDQLDDALVEQPEVYFHVADAYALATAKRDRLKFEYDIAEAELSVHFRDKAAEIKEKLTVDGLNEKLTLDPVLQDLRRDRLAAEAAIKEWEAVKEAFAQRSYMLRELVPMYLARFNSGSVTLKNPRDALAEAAQAATAEGRQRYNPARRRNDSD